MREIKFRAWETKKEFMILPDWLTGIIWNRNEIPDSIEYNDGEGLLLTSNFILQEYTGLKDKNGKEIYDGDIVEYEDYYMINAMKRAKEKLITEVIWCNYDGWRFEIINLKDLKTEGDLKPRRYNDFLHYEVIGNIYENPELLKR